MHAGGSVATPTFDETRVYCSDKKGLVYALDKLTGETIWTYQLKKGTATSGIVIGDYYVVGSNHKRIYMIDKATGEVKSKRRLSGGLSASPAFYKGYIYALSNKGDVYAFGY
jgi:outer membrane protein assembly factor BamB